MDPAVTRLRQARPDLQIRWRAFELRPEPVPPLAPQGEYLRRVWQQAVYPLARKLDMKMELPPVQPRSRNAHEAAFWARRHGRFDAYHAALFRAFFEKGLDIGRREVLTALAADLGMEAQSLERALDGHRYAKEVTADEEEADRVGIRAVPAFVSNGRLLATGVRTAETLQELLERTVDYPGPF